jgi:hypothetical protein
MNKKILSFVLPIFVTLMLLTTFGNKADAQITSQLEEGAMGTEVSSLQTFLASSPQVYPQGLVTGYFGPLTRAAVTQFQIAYGIPAVGRVGPQTLVVMNSLINSGLGIDVQAPFISNVDVDTSDDGARISWNTNEVATGKVYYSKTPMPLTEVSVPRTEPVFSGLVLVDNDLDMSKSIDIENLEDSTSYYYVIVARDRDGNVSVSLPQVMTTS